MLMVLVRYIKYPEKIKVVLTFEGAERTLRRQSAL
jgi:hypothetical protein